MTDTLGGVGSRVAGRVGSRVAGRVGSRVAGGVGSRVAGRVLFRCRWLNCLECGMLCVLAEATDAVKRDAECCKWEC